MKESRIIFIFHVFLHAGGVEVVTNIAWQGSECIIRSKLFLTYLTNCSCNVTLGIIATLDKTIEKVIISATLCYLSSAKDLTPDYTSKAWQEAHNESH